MVETDEQIWSSALELLRRGRYAEGWPRYEVRRRIPRMDVWTPDTNIPEWSGQDVSGRRIVVLAEQGFGDQIMFGRFLPILQSMGAEILVWCHPAYVARIFEKIGYLTRPCWRDRPIPSGDYWVHIGSLPFHLGSIPPPPPMYVNLPLSSGGGIGVMARGGPNFSRDTERSLPPTYADRLQMIGLDLSPSATGALDFLDTAEIISSMDAIITVDTAVAHVAGSIGKKCIVLLPYYSDFRWGRGIYSDWYPEIELIRQPDPGNWDAVFKEIDKLNLEY